LASEARSSAMISKLPPPAFAASRTSAVAASALARSRAAPTTSAPWAASARAVSTPSPAETPVTRKRLPERSTPESTSSVVDLALNWVMEHSLVGQGGGEGPVATKIGDAAAAALPDHGVRLPDPVNASRPALPSLARGHAASDVGAMQDMLESMRDQVMRHADSPYYETPIPRVFVATQAAPTDGVATVYEPVTCLILQGSKQVIIGDAVVQYDASS